MQTKIEQDNAELKKPKYLTTENDKRIGVVLDEKTFDALVELRGKRSQNMSYQIIVDKSVEKDIDKFADEVVERLNEKMEMIAENPRGQGVKKMKGRNAYRARVGDYRLIYTIFRQTRFESAAARRPSKIY